jgi:hypothetical protein
MFFSRRRTMRWIDRAVAGEVDRTRGDYHLEPGEVDLRRLTHDAFRRSGATDLQRLRDAGVDAEAFYSNEMAPCWEGLGPTARKSKLMQFVRIANAASGDDLGETGIATTIRAKTLLLAWAYDHAYGGNFVERLRRSSREFGTDELVGHDRRKAGAAAA